MVFLDQTACQNVPNVTRTLYMPKQKNIIIKEPSRAKITATGIQGINCPSFLMFNKTNNSLDFIKFLIKYRIQLTEDKNLIKELNTLLENPNITDEYIKEEISKTGLSRHDLNEKINDKLYSNLDKQKTIETVIKVCQKENKNNERKIRVHKQQNFLKNLEQSIISKLTLKEKKLNIILDNYRVHHAKIVETACKILNIELIYLPPYSPDLNPIEDVWRLTKKDTYNFFFDNFNQLINEFEKKFYQIVDQKTLTTNWINTYIN